MFPFIIRGKVSLGPRRDYHLSVTGLEERLAERLIDRPVRSEVRPDGTTPGNPRGLLSEGMHRLRTLGLFSITKLRKVLVLDRKDELMAFYELDATASSLVNLVILPLVVGSILFSSPMFSTLETVVILLLMFTSWCLDTLMLVMMVRHEITQVASEIRAVMLRRDGHYIDPIHEDLEPEELLATAYYYERNGLVNLSEAYLGYLVARHPASLEAELAEKHMVDLGLSRGPESKLPGRGRRGEPGAPSIREAGPGKEKRGKWLRGRLGLGNQRKGRPDRGKTEAADTRKPGRFKAALRRRYGRSGRMERVREKRRQRHEGMKAGPFPREKEQEEKGYRERAKRLLREPLRWEGREERRRKKQVKRWVHGPPRRRDQDPGRQGEKSRRPRPVWWKTREERRALEREKRWREGPAKPSSTQKKRDLKGRITLLLRGIADQEN